MSAFVHEGLRIHNTSSNSIVSNSMSKTVQKEGTWGIVCVHDETLPRVMLTFHFVWASHDQLDGPVLVSMKCDKSLWFQWMHMQQSNYFHHRCLSCLSTRVLLVVLYVLFSYASNVRLDLHIYVWRKLTTRTTS